MVGFRVEDPAPEAVFAYGQCVVCDCGVPVGSYGKRRRTCSDECHAETKLYGALRSAARRRQEAAQVPPTREKRCPECGEVKPVNRETWYLSGGKPVGRCRQCKLKALARRRAAMTPEEKLARSRAAQARIKADPVKLAAQREAQRYATRARRQANPDLDRESCRRWRERNRRKVAEASRAARLRRAEAAGRDLPMAPEIKRPDDSGLVNLPAWPLAAVIDRMAEHEERAEGNPDAIGDGRSEHLRWGVVCERADVPARSARAWRCGERSTVQFDVADRALTRLDLLWWEVWDEETLRLPALTVVGYVFDPKGRRRLASRRRHGDLGPDLDALETVRRAFEGP